MVIAASAAPAEFQSAADMARDAAYLVDPHGEDDTVGLVVAVVTYLSEHPEDEDLDGGLLERAARANWLDGLPLAICDRLRIEPSPPVVAYDTPEGPACLGWRRVRTA